MRSLVLVCPLFATAHAILIAIEPSLKRENDYLSRVVIDSRISALNFQETRENFKFFEIPKVSWETVNEKLIPRGTEVLNGGYVRGGGSKWHLNYSNCYYNFFYRK